MTKFSLLLISIFTFSNIFAQATTPSEFSKNVIHGSLGSFVYFNSAQLNYDIRLKQKESSFFKAYYLNLKAGGQATLDFSGARSGTGYLSSIGITGLTGSGKNHFEISLGLGYFIDTVKTFDDDVPLADIDESTFFPAISIGYRKQTTKGFVFRTGVGIAEWFYVGFGWSF